MNRFVLSALVVLSACNTASEAPPLAGAKIGGPFALIDQNGQSVTDQTIGNIYRIMYFGYTSCPDVCPTDVANLARGLKALRALDPQAASKVRLVFVSVDPARDTPPVLKAFTQNFDPKMLALTGRLAAIENTAKAFGVSFSIAPNQDKTTYLVDHSRVSYLMDPSNTPIALVPQDAAPDVIAAVLKNWVK